MIVSEVSNSETSARQQRSIRRSNSGIEFKSRSSNAIWLVTVECRKSCDTLSSVKLLWREQICSVCFCAKHIISLSFRVKHMLVSLKVKVSTCTCHKIVCEILRSFERSNPSSFRMQGSFTHINSGKIFEHDCLSSDSVAKSATQKLWVF